MDKKQNIIISDLLKTKSLTISLAESLTGGNLASTFVSVPGSSSYFYGGVIAYDNLVKRNLLKVPAVVLEKHGAVSEECALSMVQGIKELFHTDIGISLTGIAGPGGATPDKPVGLVYAGFKIKEKEWVKKFTFSGEREEIIKQSVTATIEELITALKI